MLVVCFLCVVVSFVSVSVSVSGVVWCGVVVVVVVVGINSRLAPPRSHAKRRKTSFRRDVIAGSTHSRQATGWLAEIDQATSLQDLDDVGFVFNSHPSSFETLDSQIPKCLVKTMTPRSRNIFRCQKNSKKRRVSRCCQEDRWPRSPSCFSPPMRSTTFRERLAQHQVGQRQSQQVRCSSEKQR